jgi:hypothetical protein
VQQLILLFKHRKMRIIQKLLFAVTGILGASFGILTTLLANWGFNIGLSFTEAFFYGLFGGLLVGWLIAIYVSMIVMKYIRRKLMTKFGGLFSIASGLLGKRRF